MQMMIKFKIKSQDGVSLDQTLFNTINTLGEKNFE